MLSAAIVFVSILGGGLMGMIIGACVSVLKDKKFDGEEDFSSSEKVISCENVNIYLPADLIAKLLDCDCGSESESDSSGAE